MTTLQDSEDAANLTSQRADLLRRLDLSVGGMEWCADHTSLVDRLVVTLYERLLASMPDTPKLAVVATGGYGRRELAPFSDVDLTVVPLEDDSPHLDEALRTLFRALHSTVGAALGLEIGYAFRLIADLPGLDAKSRTGLLDARLVAGSETVFSRLMDEFWRTLPAGEFILAKIQERSEAMSRNNDSPLVVEPHLKEGAGGLRAFQSSNWIRAAIGERAARTSEEYDTLIQARNLLHKVSGRRQDQLTRTRQSQLAESLDIDNSEFMRRVTRALIAGENRFAETVQHLREARFPLSDSVVSIRGEARILPGANLGQAAVGISTATKLKLDVSWMKHQVVSRVDGAAVLYACSTGEATIRNLDRCGLLEILLPELTDCRTLAPGDPSHTFTVFEHSLRVVRRLDRVDEHRFLREVRASISDVEPLYLAALLHDVGKARSMVSGRPHSIEGEEIARDVCQRWGLSEGVTETVCWLVREHLTMAHFMRMRDMQNPTTITDFASVVGDADRLNMLALLTWADVSSVAEGTFTSAQDSFLRQLVEQTMGALEGDSATAPDPSQARRRLLRELSRKNTTEAEVDAFLGQLPAYYLISTSPDLVRLHMQYAAQAADGRPTVEMFHQPDLGATDVTVCALDAPGLLSHLLGVFYAFDLSLIAIRASTTSGGKPVAIDTFTVSFGGRPIPGGTWRSVSNALSDILAGRLEISDLLTRRAKEANRRQQILDYKLIDGTPAILEVKAPRGRGMAYRIARQLKEHGLNVVSARVGQWAGHGAAAFYLERADGIGDRINAALATPGSA